MRKIVAVTESDLELRDGRTLHIYDARTDGDERLAVFWHHGTPNVGEPPEPLFPAAARLGIRWVSYDRPGYGGSTRLPGRTLRTAASDVSSVADALGIDRFGVMGHSGGSTHALACGALLGERVVAAVCVSSLAPIDADGLDWFTGMAPAGAAELRAARAGRSTLGDHLASTEFDPNQFTPQDHAALSGEWGWLGAVAGKALEDGWSGMVDDDLAYVAPWGFDPKDVSRPVLFVHGERDRIAPSAHARWLAGRIPSAELWLRPDDGHISILRESAAAMEWLKAHTYR